MRERDGFRTFPHGVTHFVISEKRIDGGWHVSIARQFRIFMCTTSLLTNNTKKMFREAYNLLLVVHVSLRVPLHKKDEALYQLNINALLECMKRICESTTPSGCNSVKYHLPYHWLYIRLQIGCSASEKSLERKLGEAQKKYFAFTNGKSNGATVYLTYLPYIPLLNVHFECTFKMHINVYIFNAHTVCTFPMYI